MSCRQQLLSNSASLLSDGCLFLRRSTARRPTFLHRLSFPHPPSFPPSLPSPPSCRPPVSWFLPSRTLHVPPSLLGRYISAIDSEATVYAASLDSDNFIDSDDELRGQPHADEAVRTDKEFLVVNFYALVNIVDPQLEVSRHSSFMEGKDIHGRIYVSYQGINAQYSGPREDVMAYAEWVKEDPRFSDTYIQVSPSFDGHAFPRLRLRYKPSLVQVDGGTMDLPITDPTSRATPLSPKDWKQKLIYVENPNGSQIPCISEKDGRSQSTQRPVILLDVRNGYEWDIGHFKGAQRPPVDCFKSTEFGAHCNANKENDPLANVDKENTDVLMYCTGGIRCDVYAAVLRKQGFKNLYSLQGGVARYLIEENSDDWLGNLFVFDSRLAVPPPIYKNSDLPIKMIDTTETQVVEFGRCSLCDGPLSHRRHHNCANLDCNKLFLCCEQCANQMKGCCSPPCTSAPRQRPYLNKAQQYKRWHNYRGNEWLLERPLDHVGKRAKRRQRRLEQQQSGVYPETVEILDEV